MTQPSRCKSYLITTLCSKKPESIDIRQTKKRRVVDGPPHQDPMKDQISMAFLNNYATTDSEYSQMRQIKLQDMKSNFLQRKSEIESRKKIVDRIAARPIDNVQT